MQLYWNKKNLRIILALKVDDRKEMQQRKKGNRERKRERERKGEAEKKRVHCSFSTQEEMRMLPVNCMLKLPRVSFSFARSV